MKTKLAIAIIAVFAIVFGIVLNTTHQSPKSYAEASYVTDVSDPRKLAGLADNVFIGTVKSPGETHYIGDVKVPSTLFSVEVNENIKGRLSGLVVVNQDGGINAGNDKILVNGDALLEEERQYLFATRRDAKGRWNTLVPLYGDVPIDNQNSYVNLKGRFMQATKEQILFSPEKR